MRWTLSPAYKSRARRKSKKQKRNENINYIRDQRSHRNDSIVRTYKEKKEADMLCNQYV